MFKVVLQPISFQDVWNCFSSNREHKFHYLGAYWNIFYSNKENEALVNLKHINGSIPFIRNPLSNYGLIAKWAPFYGKINTFNKIFYFDWSFGLGVGKLNTKSNATTVSDEKKADTYNKESYTTIIGKTELTFYASKNLHFGLGLIMNNYKAPGPTIVNVPTTNKYRNNLDSVLSIGVSF